MPWLPNAAGSVNGVPPENPLRSRPPLQDVVYRN